MKRLTERARTFRKEPTRGEARLWSALRNRALGVRFYRQKVVGPFIPFIPDFVCERPKLIVWVDGPVNEEQLARDRERQELLEARGYTVLRVCANDAEHDVDQVLGRIAAALVTKRGA